MKKLFILFALILLLTPSAHATRKVLSWPANTPINVCVPSDANTDCGGGTGSSQWGDNGTAIYYSSGNVGIGSASPSQKLDVSGTVRATSLMLAGTNCTGANGGALTVGADGVVVCSDDDSGAGSGVNAGVIGRIAYYPASGSTVDDTSAIYTDNTNVGIGSTVPRTKLDVAGSVTATAFFGNGGGMSGVVTTESDPVVKALSGLIKSNGSTISSITDSSANWDTAYTDRLKWDGGSTGLTAATGRTSLALDSASTVSFAGVYTSENIGIGTSQAVQRLIVIGGNVGVGSSNPQTALVVNGTATATAFTGPLTGAVTGTASGNLISGGTLTSGSICRYDGSGIDCDRVEDATGDCAANAVCMGGHNHDVSGLTWANDWMMAYSNGTGTQELAVGGANTFLMSNGEAAPSWTASDASGDCAANTVCLGNHTHSSYASLSNSGNIGINTTAVGNNRLTVISGNVGIGSTNARSALDVIGTITGTLSGTATGLSAQYIDWSQSSGATSIANKPTLGALAAAAYPGSGVVVSNGSAWTTSLTSDGSGDCTSGAVCLGDHTHSGYLSAVPTLDAVLTAGATSTRAVTIGTTTAGTVNKVTITAPASGSILTIADGKTLTVTNTANINTLSDGKWCKYTASGTVINCDQDAPAGSSQWLTNGVLIGTTGSVGIGSTAPQARLDVTGTAYVNGNIGVGTSAPIAAVQVKSSGNTGIGTTAPTQKVEVVGTVKATAFQGDGTGITGISGSLSGMTPGMVQKSATSTTLSSSVIYDSGVNVGIGSLVPQAKLDIEGSIYVGNGNVGIGSSVPTQAIDVVGTVKATLFLGSGASLTGVVGLGTDAVDTITEIAAALKDGSGDCSSGLLCLGDHTHSTYATLANPVFSGTADFGGAVLEIPNGSAVTDPAAVGQVAIDSTSGQFLWHDGTAQRVATYKYTECKTIETPADTDDNVTLWMWPEASTITNVYCETQGSSTPNIAMTLSDGTNALEAITCSDAGQADDGTLTNNTFTARERVEVDFGAPSGTVTWVNICVTRTIDAD